MANGSIQSPGGSALASIRRALPSARLSTVREHSDRLDATFRSPMSPLTSSPMASMSVRRQSLSVLSPALDGNQTRRDIQFRYVDVPPSNDAVTTAHSEGAVSPPVPQTPVVESRRIYSARNLLALRGIETVQDQIRVRLQQIWDRGDVGPAQPTQTAESAQDTWDRDYDGQLPTQPARTTQTTPHPSAGQVSSANSVTWALACDPTLPSPLSPDDCLPFSMAVLASERQPIQLRRSTSQGEMEVNWDVRRGNENYRLATFDWACAIPHRRLAFIEDEVQPLGGILRVYVEACAAIGMERVDQLVWSEIEVARCQGRISEDVAECVWQGWSSSGNERMLFLMEQVESPNC